VKGRTGGILSVYAKKGKAMMEEKNLAKKKLGNTSKDKSKRRKPDEEWGNQGRLWRTQTLGELEHERGGIG